MTPNPKCSKQGPLLEIEMSAPKTYGLGLSGSELKQIVEARHRIQTPVHQHCRSAENNTHKQTQASVCLAVTEDYGLPATRHISQT